MATRRGPDNSVRVAISGLCQGNAWANVFWAQLTVSGTPSQADLDSWLTAFQAAYKTQFAGLIQSAVTFTQAQAALFLPAAGFLPSLIPMTGAGTGAGTVTVPESAAAIISWQAGVYWRGGKPRTYLPLPPAANIQTNDKLTAAAQTAYLSSAGSFRTAINALTAGAITGTQLGFVSFQTGGADRVPPVFYGYTGAKIHPRLGTQRRRLGKWAP